MTTNPLDEDDSNSTANASAGTRGNGPPVSDIGVGVVATPPTVEGGITYVAVMPAQFDTPIPAQVPAPSAGDVIPLQTGQIVTLGYMGDTNPPAIVLGHVYGDTDVPTAVIGERVIGHVASETTVRFKPNGDLVIDGGSKGVIHDLSLTTDGDGHVTDVTPERRDDILI